MIHRQESGWFYFACDCGICGRPRLAKRTAVLEGRAHASVCSQRKQPRAT